MISAIRDANLSITKQINRACIKMTKPSNPNIKIKKEDVKNTVMKLLKQRRLFLILLKNEYFHYLSDIIQTNYNS